MFKHLTFVLLFHPFVVLSANSASERIDLLLGKLVDGPLKNQLVECQSRKIPLNKSLFSIGHRGASLYYPEHTIESYIAASKQGAGVIECDVTFTRDKQLVCRHSQCDLHRTTDVLMRPELAKKCAMPFQAADLKKGTYAKVKCCTSDFTQSEFLSLRGKFDEYNPMATSASEYVKVVNDDNKRRRAYGTVMTHKQSIALFKELSVKMTPELKTPSVEMPYKGFSQQAFAQALIDEYKEAGIDPKQVFIQSFNLSDIKYWLKNTPKYAKQAVFLEERYDRINSANENWGLSFAKLKAEGINYIGAPLWTLVTLDDKNELKSSAYAVEAKRSGLNIIAWTLERSGDMADGGGWYYQSVKPIVKNIGFTYAFLDFLVNQVEVTSVFSDWPETTSFYANCFKTTAGK